MILTVQMNSRQPKTKNQLMSADSCRAYCFRLLNRRSYSEYELLQKLKERKAPEQVIEQTISKLREEGFVNDANLCEAVIHYRSAVTKHGYYSVKRELQRRGIDAETADAVLAEEYDEGKENAAALLYLQKQIRRLHLEEDDELPREKLFAAMARRGFSSSATAFAFENFAQEE